MTYSVSATKLQTYQRCPQSYYFRYERKLRDTLMYRVAALGQALHQALAPFHGDWHYQEPQLPRDWLLQCWQAVSQDLEPSVQQEGERILHRYYDCFIAPHPVSRRPLAVEGLIQGHLYTKELEFVISGRYDRLDLLDDGLELLDYKSTREMKLPDTAILDLQLGLYSLALQQRYGSSLRRISLIYLRQGKQFSFEVTDQHQEQVQTLIQQLAEQLRADQRWQPHPGAQCDRCSYARYCAAVTDRPEPLPNTSTEVVPLQLALQL